MGSSWNRLDSLGIQRAFSGSKRQNGKDDGKGGSGGGVCSSESQLLGFGVWSTPQFGGFGVLVDPDEDLGVWLTPVLRIWGLTPMLRIWGLSGPQTLGIWSLVHPNPPSLILFPKKDILGPPLSPHSTPGTEPNVFLPAGFIKVILYMAFMTIMIKVHTFPLFAIRPMYLAMR